MYLSEPGVYNANPDTHVRTMWQCSCLKQCSVLLLIRLGIGLPTYTYTESDQCNAPAALPLMHRFMSNT